MKFRYTFAKQNEIKTVTPSAESLAMKAYDHFINKGYEVTKREIGINGKFKEIL